MGERKGKTKPAATRAGGVPHHQKKGETVAGAEMHGSGEIIGRTTSVSGEGVTPLPVARARTGGDGPCPDKSSNYVPTTPDLAEGSCVEAGCSMESGVKAGVL
jgi:hypothetical protein